MTWSPLACGIITGKYDNGIPESSRASMKVRTLAASLSGEQQSMSRSGGSDLKQILLKSSSYPLQLVIS